MGNLTRITAGFLASPPELQKRADANMSEFLELVQITGGANAVNDDDATLIPELLRREECRATIEELGRLGIHPSSWVQFPVASY